MLSNTFFCDAARGRREVVTEDQGAFFCADLRQTAGARIDGSPAALGPELSPSGRYRLGYALILDHRQQVVLDYHEHFARLTAGACFGPGHIHAHQILPSLYGGWNDEGRLHGRKFATGRQAMDEVIDWMAFYNHRRLHSTLGYLNPRQYEKRWVAAQLNKAA